MSTVKAPFYIYKKKRPLKNGKFSAVYYYCLNEESGLPKEIVEREQRKSTGIRREGHARTWMFEVKIPELKKEAEALRQKPSTKILKDFLDPFYIPGLCPHLARIATDRKAISTRWMIDQRRRLESFFMKDALGEMPLQDIRPGHIEDWKQRMVALGRGIRSINMALTGLKTCFNEGVHRGELQVNPAQIVGSIRQKSEERGIYSIAELRRIFVEEPDVWNYPKEYFGTQHGRVSNLMVFAHAFLFATTGERPGSLLGIRWGDFQGDTIHFRGEILKTGAERTIPLLPEVISVFRQLREECVRIADDDLVFCHDSGEPLTYTWYRKNWSRMMLQAGLPEKDTGGLRRVPYSFKHSLITHLIDEGVQPYLVREYVGHSHTEGLKSLTHTQKTYKRVQICRFESISPILRHIFL